MLVELVTYTKECEKLIASASKMTLSRKSFDEIWEKMGEEEIVTWIRETVSRGHLSPWEHCYYTFQLKDVSRVLTHQLVRHRIASYTQHSQRFKTLRDIEFVIPNTMSDNPELKRKFEEFAAKASELYYRFIDEGVNPEDARYILPQGIKTKIIVTMNARELMHFFSLRMCSRAQKEIRKLAWEMWKKVYDVHPRIWEWSGPRCLQTENLIRKIPIRLTEILGFSSSNVENIEFVSEKCPEGIPRNLIVKCLLRSRE